MGPVFDYDVVRGLSILRFMLRFASIWDFIFGEFIYLRLGGFLIGYSRKWVILPNYIFPPDKNVCVKPQCFMSWYWAEHSMISIYLILPPLLLPEAICMLDFLPLWPGDVVPGASLSIYVTRWCLVCCDKLTSTQCQLCLRGERIRTGKCEILVSFCNVWLSLLPNHFPVTFTEMKIYELISFI